MSKLLFILITTLLALTLRKVSAESTTSVDYRLPKHTVPVNYQLTITTHLHLPDSDVKKFQFDGDLKIEILATETTKSITLHQRGLNITYAHLDSPEGFETWLPGAFMYNNETEMLVFPLQNELRKHQIGLLTINYNGIITEKAEGLFRYSYEVKKNEEKHHVAATFLGLTNARAVFPCYNEPQIRAPIVLQVNTNKKYKVLSNMQQLDNWPYLSDYLTTSFPATPSMPTYLLTFVILPEEALRTGIQERINIHAINTNDSYIFALSASEKILTETEKFFEQNYSLPMLGMVGIPEIEVDALEGWGLFTFETSHLYRRSYSSMSDEMVILRTIAHEIAHLFFGNMVGLSSWNHFWTKEAPTTWWTFKVIDKLYPKYNGIDMMMTVKGTVMDHESGFPFALIKDLARPQDLKSHVNGMVYFKSGSLFLMWEHALTPNVFQKGLKDFLIKFNSKVADTDNLGETLENATEDLDIDFKDVFKSWAEAPGYPLITITLEEEYYKIKQEQFFATRPSSPQNSFWTIPLTFATANSPDFTNTKPYAWMTDATKLIEKVNLTSNDNDWVIANVQQLGYYRVNYSKNLWNLLIEQLDSNHSVIHYLNRAQLIDDSISLALAKYIDLSIPLSVMNYMDKEREYLPWNAALKGVRVLISRFRGTDAQKKLKESFASKVNSVIADIGIHDKGSEESLSTKNLRNVVVDLAGRVGVEKVISDVAQMIRTSTVAPDFRDVAFCVGLRNADNSTFNMTVQQFLLPKTSADRLREIAFLTCTRVPWQQKYLLQLSVEPNGLRGIERLRLIQNLCENGGDKGIRAAIAFTKDHWADMEKQGEPNIVETFAMHYPYYITSPQQKNEYEEMIDVLIANGVFKQELKVGVLKTAEENVALREGAVETFESFYNKK